MSFLGLDVNVDDIPVIELLPPNEEILLSVKKADLKESGKTPGLYMISLVLESPEQPDKANVFDYLCIPRRDESKMTERMWKLRIQAFLKSFNVDISSLPNISLESVPKEGLPINDLIGKQGWVILEAVTNERSGELENKVKSYVLGASI
jgi:hypothetical protein